jgi:transcriptional regulator with GAF, ATPase, and Fis domain
VRRLLITWVGKTDLQASSGDANAGLGPIGQAVKARQFDEVILISNYDKRRSTAYQKWLMAQTAKSATLCLESLSSPTDFGDIYGAVVRNVEEILVKHGQGVDLTFHLSPGTPAMQAVWIILAKTRFRADLIESSREQGVKTASVPFDISAEYIPDLLRRPDEELARLSSGLPPVAPEFDQIIHRSDVMKRAIAMARRVAVRKVSVLIEGESGTGKELFARAIHQASPRKGKPFIAVNCGAIPEELVESELFGHEKGAFTGADKVRSGHFEQADGGTLFLDEIGELPRAAQVKLLRVLQENEVTRVGSSKPKKVDIRIIAATNRDLSSEITRRNFREDLFYRIASFVINLPPLRARQGDVGLLVDHLLQQLNRDSTKELGVPPKTISPGAKNLLLKHDWPGNIRELQNTLLRATVWSNGDQITVEDAKAALLQAAPSGDDTILNRDLGDGLDVRELISKVARHYLTRAMKEANGSKTIAARLVGLPSYQTLTNWLKTYGTD